MISLQPHTVPETNIDPTGLLMAIQFFANPAASTQLIQKYLRAQADAEAAVKALNEQIAEAKAALDARAASLKEGESALAGLKAHYDILVKSYQEGEAKLAARQAELDKKNAELDEQRAEIARVRREVNDKLAHLLAAENAG